MLEDPNYLSCVANAAAFENDPIGGGIYYKNILCLREVPTRQNSVAVITTAYEKLSPHLTSNCTLEDVLSLVKQPLCVLPTGHSGRCSCNIHKALFKNLPPSVSTKVETSIYSTTGNDDCVYKNRANRNFPIQLSRVNESSIRDKKVKLSCAIPLRDASTSFLMATAYTDYVAYLIHIPEIRRLLCDLGDEGAYLKMLDEHSKILSSHFLALNRTLFNELGNTICPVTGHEIRLEDIASREDSRTNPRETDVQLGHCVPRSDNEYTIRGFNICLMTREGNRIVGDEPFCSNVWLDKLRSVLKFVDKP